MGPSDTKEDTKSPRVEILGEGLPPDFPNADPVSDKNMSFATPACFYTRPVKFRPGLEADIMSPFQS